MKYLVFLSVLLGLMLSSSAAFGYTASKFVSEYGQDLSEGQEIKVLVMVKGEPESMDPAKRAKEIRHLQAAVLKFCNFAGAVNVKSDSWNNEFTATVTTSLAKVLEERSDVISIRIISPMSEDDTTENETHTFVDSVISESPEYDLQVATKVTTPDDCHGTQDGSNWIWQDGECILENPPADYKVVPRKYIFAAPLQQIKAGVALTDIQCNDGKHVVYKHDRMRAACLSDEAENQLLKRGWAALRLGLPATDDLGRDLCGWYEGKWDSAPRYCHGLKYPLLCSMAGGDVMDGSCFIPSTSGGSK